MSVAKSKTSTSRQRITPCGSAAGGDHVHSNLQAVIGVVRTRTNRWPCASPHSTARDGGLQRHRLRAVPSRLHRVLPRSRRIESRESPRGALGLLAGEKDGMAQQKLLKG